jgi:hypothetical protein
MAKKDPYKLLGIAPDTMQDDASLIYHRLALKYHPDRNPGDESAAAKMKELSEAWAQIDGTLPKRDVEDALTLNIPPGASAQEIEDAIGQYLIDMPEQRSRKTDPSTPAARDANTWSTVASERSTGMVVGTQGPTGDWTKQIIRRWKPALGLERINPDEAAALIYGRPNAFAALKIVQRIHADLCLYDAILARARGASRQPSATSRGSSTAIVIVGAELVDNKACEAALKDPLASVEMAFKNIHTIASNIYLDRVPITQQKLTFDLMWLKEAIVELAEKIARSNRPGRKRRGGGGTAMTAS